MSSTSEAVSSTRFSIPGEHTHRRSTIDTAINEIMNNVTDEALNEVMSEAVDQAMNEAIKRIEKARTTDLIRSQFSSFLRGR